jgi:peroxiredoxin
LGAALGRLADSCPVPFIATEDMRGGWSKTFGFVDREYGGARLLTADRRIAWSHDGRLDRERVAGALQEHLVVSEPPEFSAVELAVRMGESAPDFAIETAPGEQIQSTRLRGGKLVVCFAQAWATPCLAQLRRLERLRNTLERDGASVIALVEGTEYREAEELAKALGLTYCVALDSHGAIAAEFGVRIWPTTIVIDETGLVAAIHMGADPGSLAALEREQVG